MLEWDPYNEESRKLQDQFDSRRLADRMVEHNFRDRFIDEDREFIGRQGFFFLATADADGNLDCSFKGGDPGFVRLIDDRTLVFPSYEGNGMFKSMGNMRAHPAVGMLFISFEEPRRLRVNGTATVSATDPLLAAFHGAQLIVRVVAREIFRNCPRYIPRMQQTAPSPYVPGPGRELPIPAWKTMPHYQDALPDSDRAGKR